MKVSTFPQVAPTLNTLIPVAGNKLVAIQDVLALGNTGAPLVSSASGVPTIATTGLLYINTDDSTLWANVKGTWTALL